MCALKSDIPKEARSRISVFFFNDTSTTEIYTLSLHDALPIYSSRRMSERSPRAPRCSERWPVYPDRKSTRLNSSHMSISYAVFCLQKKNNPGDDLAVLDVDSPPPPRLLPLAAH